MSELAIVLVSVGGALAALVVVLSLLVARRASRRADERVSAAITELNERMESMVAELGHALERAEMESRRNRVLGELGGTIDLDDVLERVLEAATQTSGADAGLVALAEGIEGRPLIATLGLSLDETDRQGVIAGPPDGRLASSISISYRYSPEDEEAGVALVRAGLAVPLRLEGIPVGHVAVFSRTPGSVFEEDDVQELEELAERATPAIENARRFREARQLADLDALTGLHNRRFFHETLVRECARAQRYQRNLALIVFDLDDFKAINDRIGHLAGDGVLASAAERVREVVRSADIACRVGGDEFGVILPESSLPDAEGLSRRIQDAVAAQPIGQAGKMSLSAGVAHLRPDDDAASLFQRADDALYRAKESGKAQVVTAMDAAPAG